ncbi:hypothetical protein BAZOLSSOX_811 [uncultured Gammaproteobacteria bacterium]|nr:hypothetical protein BAZOLSSOX_811 [uncultured Gammaproteobacteria bacterium]
MTKFGFFKSLTWTIPQWHRKDICQSSSGLLMSAFAVIPLNH